MSRPLSSWWVAYFSFFISTFHHLSFAPFIPQKKTRGKNVLRLISPHSLSFFHSFIHAFSHSFIPSLHSSQRTLFHPPTARSHYSTQSFLPAILLLQPGASPANNSDFLLNVNLDTLSLRISLPPNPPPVPETTALLTPEPERRFIFCLLCGTTLVR